jgi:6-phosphogluconolactonase
MTLTFPTINRARRVLWVVTGNEKVPMLRRLIRGDLSIPAGRICREHAVLLADRAAAQDVSAGA